MVLLLLALVRNDLLEDWRASLPAEAPNYFMINIRPRRGEAIGAFFASAGCRRPSWCVVRARLTAINAVPVDRIQFESTRAGLRGARGEPHLGADAARRQPPGEVAAGGPTATASRPRVSVEQEYARAARLKLGDTVTYDVAGEPVSATVTSCASALGFVPAEFLHGVSRPACSTT